MALFYFDSTAYIIITVCRCECTGGQVKTGVFCLNNTAIAAASSNGNIHIFP